MNDFNSEAKCLLLINKNNFRSVKEEDNYKNCLLDKVHKKTAGKYMILDYNSNYEYKKDRYRSNSSIEKKV